MKQYTPAHSRTLVVRISFEPSRLAVACTTDAYEYVVPFVQRPLPQERPSRPDLFSTRAQRRIFAEGGSP